MHSCIQFLWKRTKTAPLYSSDLGSLLNLLWITPCNVLSSVCTAGFPPEGCSCPSTCRVQSVCPSGESLAIQTALALPGCRCTEWQRDWSLCFTDHTAGFGSCVLVISPEMWKCLYGTALHWQQCTGEVLEGILLQADSALLSRLEKPCSAVSELPTDTHTHHRNEA